MTRLQRWQDLVLPIGLIACVLVILLPLPAAVIDVLLAVNITLAIVVLVTTLYVKTPLEFSVFPTLLLTTTLGRLVLNVATTRLILTQGGSTKAHAAGQVIQAFGEFVAGDRILVGIIIFLILVVIQFVVITKGSTRISEVAARFSLDGMPGRQMAVDADLNAGLIDQAEALRRREEIVRQSDFYGAMDGASKFVRGDAIAGIVIMLVNIVAGLIIGVTEFGLSLPEAASLFTKLTIGDGLVSQIPAFLIALAAGLLVTRSTQRTNLPVEFLRQLFSRPQALAVAGTFVAVLIFTNLPTIPLLTIGSSCFGLALLLTRQQQQAEQQQEAPAAPAEKRIEEYLAVDPMEIELGVSLIRLADPKRGGNLLQEIAQIRKAVASEIGIVLPKIRVRDNMQLQDRDYQIKLDDSVVASGSLWPYSQLAILPAGTNVALQGQVVREPVNGLSAVWISRDQEPEALEARCRLLSPTQVLTGHLQDVVRKHADELLTRDATKHLIDELATTSPTLVEELIPNVLPLGQVQQILRMLLREGIPLRPLRQILEALSDQGTKTKDPISLCEFVRARLARTISARYRDHTQCLHVITVDPLLEERIRAGTERTDRGLVIHLATAVTERICREIEAQLTRSADLPVPVVVLVSPQVRTAVKQITARRLPHVTVLSFDEITADTNMETVGRVVDTQPGE